ncbi:MAG: hypothetical protein KC445_10930 [Anaerolineales bacterium]|nr:hypothetical protein [Anaerolineales bacterium]
MNQFDYNSELKAQVLTAPAYQERCQVLFELFKFSRQWDGNPQTLLALQAALGELHIDWQKKKKEFKKEQNEIGLVVVKRLILILRKIADALVWRALNYDRVAIQLLAEHQKTGHIDESVMIDFEIARQIIEDSGALVLVNDLTSTLLHGDLTIIEPNRKISIIENKSGKSSRRNSRAIRQKKQLNDLIDFLNTGFRTSKENTQDYILRAQVEIETHHVIILDVVEQAKRKGYQKKILSDCFAIEAIWMAHSNAHMPSVRPFADVDHTISQSNLVVFDETTRRIVPYSVFPFDDETCFALLTGELMLMATLNFDALKELYRKHGLTIELPNPTPEEIEAYLSASRGERMRSIKQDRSSWFVIRHRHDLMRVSPDYWGRILLEFIDENTVIQADLYSLQKIADWEIPDNQTTRMYYGYMDETKVWK